jgi:ribose transport system ATP-binding protein
MENSTLAVRGELGPVGLIMRSRQHRAFDPIAKRLGIVRASDFQPAGELSGGNQQKAVLARSLLREAPLLVVDEPTAGVDARARLDIFRGVRGQADAGAAVLLNSSDATELEGLCDRVYVMSRGSIVTELRGESVTESRIVESFVNVTDAGDRDAEASSGQPASRVSRWAGLARHSSWTPLVVIVLLLLAIGAYAAARSSVFLSDVNINNLLLTTLPLAVVALGQQVLLIAGGFDISVGANMTLAVVLTSFFITGGTFLGSIPGILLLLVIAVAIGLLNGFIVRGLGVSAIITTIATLSILAGIAIVLRPQPGGTIGSGLTNLLSSEVGPVPTFFIVVVAIAFVAEGLLRRSGPGLTLRATGLSEEATRRTGVRIEFVKVGAYVVCAVVATVAGLFLSAQVGLGNNSVGAGYALPTFTACFLGGAALTGGRGSFVGALLGALFVSLLINVTPLLNLVDAWSTTLTGVMTIVAVLAYAFTAQGTGSRGYRRARRDGITDQLAIGGGAGASSDLSSELEIR